MSPRYLPLTEREQEVLALLGRGYARSEIARELGIAARTASVLTNRVTEFLVQRKDAEAGEAPRLTRRQREVLYLLRRGRSDREIAEQLGIGLRTAETHPRRVLRRMDVRSRRKLS